MASERIQRRIDLLLDEADQALADGDWSVVRDRSNKVLALDPANGDALTFLAAAERAQGTSAPLAGQPPAPAPTTAATPAQPTSFADGRYQVKRFLGEGWKKKVYLAHDTLLDREVAFALIKTEGLDDTSRTRTQRVGPSHGRAGLPPPYSD